MYKLNLAVIILLCLAVFGGATYLAIGSGTPEPPPPTIDGLIRDLGDSDPDIRKEAENRLAESGEEGIAALELATQSKKRILASRARRLLVKMGVSTPVVKKEEKLPDPGHGPDVRELSSGVRLELSPEMEGQVYVRLVNEGTVPLLVARELNSGEIVCGTFGWFEFEDGRKSTFQVEGVRVEWVAVDPGEGIEIFVGVPVEEDGPVRIRFVYDASGKSEYRKLVQPTEKGVPLPPERLVSAWMEVTSPGN